MIKRINRFFSKPVFVATELFASGWCNLSCKYCYIPKTDFLKEIHKDIIQKIQDDRYIDTLIDMFGEDLEAISHWGTEPSLTVKLFKRFYEKADKAFPKLKTIKISSNFMTPPDNIFTWITEILPTSKELDVEIQVSCDGPPSITDKIE
jgi:sulfatase maturation enzyme AslB (radical SAM superfamily)